MNPLWFIWLELTNPRGELVCCGLAIAMVVAAGLTAPLAWAGLKQDLPRTLARIRAGEAPKKALWLDLRLVALNLAICILVLGFWAWAPIPEGWQRASHWALFGYLLGQVLALVALRGEAPTSPSHEYRARHGLSLLPHHLAHRASAPSLGQGKKKKRKGRSKKGR